MRPTAIPASPFRSLALAAFLLASQLLATSAQATERGRSHEAAHPAAAKDDKRVSDRSCAGLADPTGSVPRARNARTGQPNCANGYRKTDDVYVNLPSRGGGGGM